MFYAIAALEPSFFEVGKKLPAVLSLRAILDWIDRHRETLKQCEAAKGVISPMLAFGFPLDKCLAIAALSRGNALAATNLLTDSQQLDTLIASKVCAVLLRLR